MRICELLIPALLAGTVTASSGEALTPAPLPRGEGNETKAERKGPLAELPSAPGAHLEKIKALGDNQWVDLGSPAPDPKWGQARGRSWSPVAPFAPDMRGAFVFGEGPHGMVKPDGHYMDDLWFYDLNQHRWVCVYPGIKADGGYAEIIVNKDGFEATPDGHALPIASMVHAYGMVTYDTDRKLFLSMPCSGAYWKEGGFHKGIKGRVKGLEDNDVVVLFFHRSRDAEVPGIYVYHPEKNEWEVVAERPPELKPGRRDNWTGFYDPELNAHIMHAAGDGRDNGTMWAYRYKKATR